MPMTTDLAAAQLWMVDHCAASIKGVVAKRLDQAYRSGGRTWRKVTHQNDSGGRRGRRGRRGPGGDLAMA
jgi:ATP-dependent DNA ligase